MSNHDHTLHRTAAQPDSLWRQAIAATLHCLTGCAIGEVLGMVIGTALGWSNLATIVLAVALAFVFGYAFTVGPVLRAGVPLAAALAVAFAADTVSITVMEVLDNAFVHVWSLCPGPRARGRDVVARPVGWRGLVVG